MKNDTLPCCVVRELLPNYAEHLTGEETERLISEHLASCEKCAEIWKNLQSPLEMERVQRDLGGVNFLKKERKQTRRKVLCAIAATILACLLCLYGLVIYQHPFHFAVENVYALPNGGIYFELVATGGESGVNGVSYADGFEDGNTFEIHMGYSLIVYLMNLSAGTEAKRYTFVLPSEVVARVRDGGGVYYTQGKQKILVWDGVGPLPSAPDKIEERAETFTGPFDRIFE